MNKIVVLLISFVLAIPIWGQDLMRVPRFFDNWSVTAAGGVYHPLAYSLNGNLVSPVFGVELKKQFSPIFGLAAEYNYFVRNTHFSDYKAHRPQVHLLASYNLMNLFGGYRGQSRFFEIDVKWGMGVGTYADALEGADSRGDYLVSKVGADFNLNLGRNRVWSLTLRPAVVFDLRAKGEHHVAYHANQADVQLMAGVTYHFRDHDKRRNFSLASAVAFEPTVEPWEEATFVPVMTSAATEEKAAETILKPQAAPAVADTTATEVKPEAKEPTVAEATESGRIVETAKAEASDTLNPRQRSWQMSVAFEEGSARVDEAQFFNVEKVAYILQHRPKARVFVEGFATAEEQSGRRENLSLQRARIIKILLVAQNIPSDRIIVYGRGASGNFDVSEWPSVAICSIIDPN